MALTDEQRGERGVWLVQHRHAKYETDLSQLAKALADEGEPRSVDTIRGYEAGAAIPDGVRKALERIFGEPMPQPKAPISPEQVLEAVNLLVEEMRRDREDQRLWRETIQRTLEEVATFRQAAGPSSERVPESPGDTVR